MPIGTREVLLLLRARDQASRVLSDVGKSFGNLEGDAQKAALSSIGAGTAVAGVGITMAAAGAAGLKFFADAIGVSNDFKQAAALALTQTGNLKTSQEELGNMMVDVGKRVPAAYAGIQTTLFDIFSSTNANIPQAKLLLEQFARASVAGQADMQEASRGTMSVMNAFNIPLENVNKVLDVQFNMVRVGVGTYGEFQGAIGRAIPAAVAAGQTFETLAGSMAFLTRNGLSVDQAATSAARAMELFTKPDTIKALEDYGVKTRNLDGSFRQINDIITDLAVNKGWATMTEFQRKEVFAQIFGTGSIQARRFFDVAIPNFAQLNDLTGTMSNSAGAMDAAYDIMFKQPQSQIQLFKNNIIALRKEIGDVLGEHVNRVLAIFNKLLAMWNNLSPHTRRLAIEIAAVAAAFMVIAGIVLTVVGTFMVMSGTLELLGTSFGAILAPAALIILAIIAIAAAAYLIYRNWDTIKAVSMEVWGYVSDKINDVWHNYIEPFFNWIASVAPGVWDTLRGAAVATFDALITAGQAVWNALQVSFDAIISAWNAVTNFFATNTFIQDVLDIVGKAFENLVEIVQKVVSLIQTYWPFIRMIIQTEWDTTYPILQMIYRIFVDTFQAIWAVLQPILLTITSTIQLAWELILSVTSTTLQALWIIIGSTWGLIRDLTVDVWNHIGSILQSTWDFMRDLINGAIDIIAGTIKLFLDVLQGNWGAAWNDIKQILFGVWEVIKALTLDSLMIIVNLLKMALDMAWTIVNNGWNMITALFKLAWDGMWDIVRIVIDNIISYVRDLPGAVWDALSGLAEGMYNIGRDVMNGLWDGLKAGWHDVTGWLSKLNPGSWFNDINLELGHAGTNLLPTGQAVMDGLQKGMQSGWKEVADWLQTINPADYLSDNSRTIDTTVRVNGASILASSPVGMNSMGTGSTTHSSVIQVHEGAVQIAINGGDANVAGQVTDALDEWLASLKQDR